MTTDKRKAQYREASKNNRYKKQNTGWKRIWVPPQLIEEIRLKIKLYLKGIRNDI